jgi:hypothetical protein
MPFDIDAIPTPDLGLRCMECSYPLGGLMERRCPSCGQVFEYESFVPKGDFPALIADGKEVLLTPEVSDALRRAQIPFVEVLGTAAHLYGTFSAMHNNTRVGVPRSQYFEAVDAVKRLKDGVSNLPPHDARSEWVCPQCQEENPGTFEICWQCESERPPAEVNPD